MARCAIHFLAGEAERLLYIWCAFNAGGLAWEKRGWGPGFQLAEKGGLGGLAVSGCSVMCT
jgi:hypothetical protein